MTNSKPETMWVYQREVTTEKPFAVHRFRAGYDSVKGWGVEYSVVDKYNPDYLFISWDGYQDEAEARHRADTKAENKLNFT